ncbi:MAG: serine--tRNA ligase [Candidatus Aenigmarchaeota archaeon]|nr:serine--tRNA ligase [Candidatus Aenigmarchaeota archaeon]
MLDIKLIRDDPDVVRKDLKKRKDSEKLEMLEELIEKDKEWRSINVEIEKLKQQRNSISKEISQLKKSEKDITKQMKQASSIPKEIEDNEKKMKILKEECDYNLMRLPNILHESVPYGKDSSENVIVREWGKKPKFTFPLKSHIELCEYLDIADFDRAVKLSGSGFYILKNELALLQHALTRFTIDHLMKKKYTVIDPPVMMKREPYEGVTDLADFENVMYKIDNQDLYLIATSEHPMAGMYMNEVIDDKELPIKLCGMSPCFRKEIGSHGLDTKGLFRVHQFYKVEQFIFCKPEESWKYHEELIKNAEEIFQKLEIPYHVVNI